METKRLGALALTVAGAALLWALATAFRLGDQWIHTAVFVVALLQGIGIIALYTLGARLPGDRDRLLAIFLTITGAAGLFFTLIYPYANVLPPNVWPFTAGAAFLYYVIEGYAVLVSLELGIHHLLTARSPRGTAPIPAAAES
jgi:hypothetical protein